jgi:hypothetical protein
MNRNTPINVHELLKTQVFSEDITPHSRNSSNSGTGNKHNDKYMFFEQNRPYSQQTFGVSDSYLILDSFTKAAASELEFGILSWNIQTQGPTNVDQGIIGAMRLLGNVIEIELGSFTLPILKEGRYPINTLIEQRLNTSNISLIQNNNSGENLIPVLPLNQIPSESQAYTTSTHSPWLNNPLSQTPFGGQITIQLKEAGSQAYSGGHISGSLHHFIFQIQYDANKISPNSTNVIPMSEGTNIYIFTEPIIDFNTITLLFRNPDYPIYFEPDIINCDIICDFINSINGNYFLQFYYKDHNLLTEDRIYLKNAKTGIQNLDAYLNSADGLLVGNSPTGGGTSQNDPTGTILSNTDIFYLDPFVAFNQSFLITTNIYIVKIDILNILKIEAIVIFSFGEKKITLELPLNTTTTITDNFNINNVWYGTYTINVTDTNTATGTATINRLIIYNSPVYIAKRRIRIPIRLRTIVNKVTNYITPI